MRIDMRMRMESIQRLNCNVYNGTIFVVIEKANRTSRGMIENRNYILRLRSDYISKLINVRISLPRLRERGFGRKQSGVVV